MSNLQKSKRFDLIDNFNDTSRYLDDIFTIDNPEFAKLIPDIYPRELQLNKENTSDKETCLFQYLYLPASTLCNFPGLPAILPELLRRPL